MEEKKITFDNLPEAISFLIEEINEVKELIVHHIKPAPAKSLPIGIDEACQIIGKAKSTIYTLVNKKLIPCYKNGKQLYFYENELLDWIASGRKKSTAETKAEIEKQMQKTVRNKPTKYYF